MESGLIGTLSRPTSAQLRSAVVIPSFAQILNELVQNSLDAGAGSINCYLDLSTSNESMRVEDDGHGMDLAQMRDIGRRHASSKERNAEAVAAMGTYGFRGEALSSVGCLALLEVTTRPVGTRQTWTKVVKHGKTVYSGDARRPLDRSHGTTVIVKDFFEKIPVRQATLSAAPTSTLAACKKVIETLALVHPTIKWTLWTERAVGTSLDGGSKKVLSVGGVKSAVDVYRSLYGNAGVETVQKVRVSSGPRRVEGFISLEGALSKSHQHLYVNRFPVDRGDLHLAIAKRFAPSRFSMLSGPHDGQGDLVQALRRSPRRLERYPVFVLDVTIPANDLDLAFEPKKGIMSYSDADKVKALLLAVVDEFLDRHGFSARRPIGSASLSPTRASSTPAALPVLQRPVDPPLSRPVSALPTRLRPGTARPTRPPSSRMTDYWSQATPRPGPDTVNKKARLSAAPRSDAINDRQRVPWIEEMLAVSPSFYVLVPRLILQDVETGVLPSRPDPGTCCPSDMAHPGHYPAGASALAPGQDVAFSREALLDARVIKQVDNKFICCTIQTQSDDPNSNARSLVLIDQHAADERIAVEAILRNLCTGFRDGAIERTVLPQPAPLVLLSREEAEVFRSPGVSDVFLRWGADLLLETPRGDGHSKSDFAQLRVQAVPSILRARLGRPDATEMSRLVSLYLQDVREMLPAIDNYLLGPRDTGAAGWTRILAWMPKEMLELANSRACRKAIMFGDKLDQEQCSRLIAQLAQTQQPFVCAHGRPSLVPLGILPEPISRRPTCRRIDWQRFRSLQAGR